MISKLDSLPLEEDIIASWKENISSPEVSIRCLTYNQEKYIEKCILGFLNQKTSFSFEIIIHDDASTDRTAEIVRFYQKRYPQIIRPIYETTNQYSKHDGSIHRIVDSSLRGRYVAFCEGDDYWIDCNKLQKQYNFLENHSDYSMVFHTSYHKKDGNRGCTDAKSRKECDFSTDEIIRGGGSFCATASLFMRTHMMRDRYAFQDLASISDYPLQIAISLKGKVHYIPDIMCVYRLTEDNKESWTRKVTKDNEKMKAFCANEELWLRNLNEVTEYKYNDAIKFALFMNNCRLYKINEISLKDMQNSIHVLSTVDKKKAIWIMTKIRIKKRIIQMKS